MFAPERCDDFRQQVRAGNARRDHGKCANGRPAELGDAPGGLRLWVGSRVAEFDADGRVRFAAAKGVQKLVMRVDTAARAGTTLRLTVEPAEGSTARVTPVTGP